MGIILNLESDPLPIASGILHLNLTHMDLIGVGTHKVDVNCHPYLGYILFVISHMDIFLYCSIPFNLFDKQPLSKLGNKRGLYLLYIFFNSIIFLYVISQDEENMNMKEVIRSQVRSELSKLETTCRDMASVLRGLGIFVGISPSPQSSEV